MRTGRGRGVRIGVVALALAVAGAAGCSGTPGGPDPAGTPASPASKSPAANARPGHPGQPGQQDPGAAYRAGRSTPVRDTVYKQFGNPAIDVLHYGLTLHWSPTGTRLDGKAALVIRRVSAGSAIELDLSSALNVDRVTVDGAPARFGRTGANKLTVDTRRLPADASTTVTITYHGVPRDVPAPALRSDMTGLGVQLNRTTGSAYSMQEPYGAFTWYPVVDQPSDRALYDVSLTVPRGWTGVTSGRFLGRSDGPDDTTYRWRSTDPMSSYLMAFSVDRLRMYRATGPHGLPITYWVPEANPEAYLPVLRKTPEILAWLEKRFGRYPFESAGVVIEPSSSAMETQGMVSLGMLPVDPSAGGVNSPTARGSIEVLEHELSHAWFGDAVGPRDWRSVWLNEGFAMYAQMQWEAAQSGATIDAVALGYRADDARVRKSAGPTSRWRANDFADNNVYIPPALMLDTIRRKIGDERYGEMVRAWVRDHRSAPQDRASFTAFVNSFTGRDFTPLIAAWLDSPTTPKR